MSESEVSKVVDVAIMYETPLAVGEACDEAIKMSLRLCS